MSDKTEADRRVEVREEHSREVSGYIDLWVDTCGSVAKEKGFHDSVEMDGGVVRPTSPVERMMLIVSEVSEMMEAYRARPETNFTFFEVDGKPEGIPSELADIVIRCFDFAFVYNIPLGEIMVAKTIFNHTRRSHRHGGKAI